MSNIILIVDGTTTFHDSIEDAIECSKEPKYDDSKAAHIYAYQMSARKGGFRWDGVSNYPREKIEKPKQRKKSGENRRMKRWNDAEQELLVKALADNKSVEEIASSLHRSEKAIQLRIYKTITSKDAVS